MLSKEHRFTFRDGKMVTGRIGGGSDKVATVAVDRKSKARSTETAGISGFGSDVGFGSSNASVNVMMSGPLANTMMMTGLIPDQEEHLRRYYRDIYFYDSVAGAAVDTTSSFPFSEYTLMGADPKQLEKFQESMVRLNVRSLMPEISTAYLVDGCFVGSPLFASKDKVFRDILIHSIDDCNITPSPFFGTDPLIKVRNSKHLQEFMQSNGKEARAIKEMLDPRMRQAFSAPGCQLDSLTTIYMERRTLPGAPPTSYLKRILPAYLVEKTLYRGTLVEVNKRQRAFLHVTMGDDTWEPTPQEMNDTVNQFQLADQDPLGAVLGTRNGVQATEVRQGGDFWKWTDNIDTMTAYKLRALGISEAFLSGDASYSNAETAMSVFMENMDTYRSFMTYKVFTNKVFPIIAIANNFYKSGKQAPTGDRASMMYQMSNYNDLVIPTIRWHKQLEARSEENMNEMLEALREKGIPIPIRMWLAASKVDLNTLFQDLQEDDAIKKKLAEYSGQDPKDIADPDAGAEQADDMAAQGTDPNADNDDDDQDSEFASVFLQGRMSGIDSVRRALHKGRARQSILGRTYDGRGTEVAGVTKTGKPKFIPSARQKNATDMIHKNIAKAVKELSNPNVRQATLKKVAARLGGIPMMLDELTPFKRGRR